MTSSGTTTTGSVVTLVSTNEEVVLVNDDDSIGTGVISQTISEAFISLGSGTTDSTISAISDEDVGATAGVGLDIKLSTTDTEEGGGAGEVLVENLGWDDTDTIDVDT